MSSRRKLDGLARDLATGEISRRAALARLVGGAVAVGVASVPGASALASRSEKCPKSRRCGDKCCPKHAKCKHGKCKCVSGYTKCGKKCVDLQTNASNCGDCGTVCAEGEGCFSGQCVTPNNCGNSQVDPGEVCDGNDLNGETCVSQGFLGGTLACNPNCMAFVTTGCTMPECDGPEDCPVAAVGSCQQAVCSGGMCDFAADDSNLPEDNNDCTDNVCTSGVPTHPPKGLGTGCNQNGGTVCDGNGTCVQCNAASDCPQPPAINCQVATCQSHTCGTANAPSNTQCVPPSCNNGLLTPARTCNGAGTCNGSGAPQSCSPYVCRDSQSCGASCSVPSDCASGFTCASSVCKKANGQACSSGVECATNFCVDGYCCDSSCGTCRVCSTVKGATANGVCTNVSAGQDPDNECTGGAGVCNGSGMCI